MFLPGSVFRPKVAGKLVTVTGGQGKQKIPGRQEWHTTDTWLCLEPLCSQMKNECHIRASGTQRFSDRRSEQPESQAFLSPASCPDLPLCPVPTPWNCAYTYLAPGWAVLPDSQPSSFVCPSGFRALLSCGFDLRKDKALLTAAAGTQQACFPWDTSK